MIRVLVQDGRLIPLDPIPEEWYEGAEVKLLTWEPIPEPTPEEIDRMFRETETEGLDEEDWQRMQAAIEEHRRLYKPRLPEQS
jgi:hypothetical protein